jgi:hypothetical protein
MENIEPTQSIEYILKGVVNAAYGQEHNSVQCLFHCNEEYNQCLVVFSMNISNELKLISRQLVIHLMNVVSK